MAVADLPTYGYRRVWRCCDGSRSGTACLWLMQSGCIAL
nr:Transposase InsD for insertion element IS2 [Escherichia coli]